MRLFAISALAGACLVTAATASAEELRLGDAELDSVTAGTLLPADSPFSVLNSWLVGQAAGQIAVYLDAAYQEQHGQHYSTNPEVQPLVDGLFQIYLDRPKTPPTFESFPSFGGFGAR